MDSWLVKNANLSGHGCTWGICRSCELLLLIIWSQLYEKQLDKI